MQKSFDDMLVEFSKFDTENLIKMQDNLKRAMADLILIGDLEHLMDQFAAVKEILNNRRIENGKAK